MSSLTPGFEGTLDGKRIKFRVVALAKEGSGAVLLYGDGSDFEVEDGSLFPAIPPAVSKSRLPQLICNQKQLRLWHLQDRKFKRPIAELRLRLRCGGANKSRLHQACADLLVCLCADAVTEISYLASVCDLGSSISNDDVGFILRVHGFDDKLLALFLAIFPVLLSFRGPSGVDTLPDAISVARFQACHEIMMRRYANSGLKSSHLARQVRIQCLRSTSWSAFEKVRSLKHASLRKTDSSTFVVTGNKRYNNTKVHVNDTRNHDLCYCRCVNSWEY
jgi:secreted Zn-dependent insulinase-like peptidase